MNVLKPQRVVARLTNSQVRWFKNWDWWTTGMSKDSGASRANGNFSKQHDDQCRVMMKQRDKSHFLSLSLSHPSVGESYKALIHSEVSTQIHKHEHENCQAWKQSLPRTSVLDMVPLLLEWASLRWSFFAFTGGEPYFHCAFTF